jgi:peptidyl-prolyl cis-trans isomerase D
MEANKVSFAYVAGLYSTIDSDDKSDWCWDIITWRKMKKFKAEETREVVCFNCRWSIKEDEAGVKERISDFVR